MFIVLENGRVDFIEFSQGYMTSSSNFNHYGKADYSYAAVVDYNCINLTPLGKFLMPPPMFEKQIQLQSPVSLIYMYGILIAITA